MIDGIGYMEHGDIVEMEVHRGGGYFDPDESLHTGGAWTRKLGVAIVKQAPTEIIQGNPNGEVIQGGRPACAWVCFLDGGMQATDTRMDKRGWPDGPKTFVRKADPEELARAERF